MPQRSLRQVVKKSCNDHVSTDYVRAQWAYSELNSLEQGYKYRDVAELKKKLAQKVPFASLSDAERILLVRKWHEVRGIFAVALAGISTFQLQHWTKSKLGPMYILRHFFQWLPGNYASRKVTFKEWIEAEPFYELLSEHHPLREPASAGPFVQDHPVTVGPLQGLTLLDGYHRAVRFWRSDDRAAEIAVYVPLTRNVTVAP
jgi:hypothetical protein